MLRFDTGRYFEYLYVMAQLQTSNEVKRHSKIMQNEAGPVVWAVDLARMGEEPLRKMVRALRIWNPDQREVYPVSVVSPFDLGWVFPLNNPEKKMALAEAQHRLKLMWNRMNMSSEEAVVLHSPNHSLRQRVMTLIQFAEQKKARFILVGSGAQSSSNIMGLGSFAELLITLSKIPVLVVGENVEIFEPASKILFPTDFSQASKEIFKKVVSFATQTKAEILLYHHLDLTVGPMLYGVPGGLEGQWLDSFWKSHEELRRDDGIGWQKVALKSGVICDFVCDRSLGALHSRVSDTARLRGINLVALGIQRSPWGQVILGHNVRSIFVTSPCPVLVIHS